MKRCKGGGRIHFALIISLCSLFSVEQIFRFAEDLEIDIPQLWKYIAELMGPTAFDGNLDLDELFFKRVLNHVSKNKAAKLFAHLLQTATNESVSSVTVILHMGGLYTQHLLCLGGIVLLLRKVFLVFCFCSCVLVNTVSISKLWPWHVQRITTLKSSGQVDFFHFREDCTVYLHLILFVG